MPQSKPRTNVEAGSRAIYPVLPLRDIVVFPHMIVPLFVGREKSIKALEDVVKTEKLILLATQKNAGDDDPAIDAIHSVGTLATVLQLLKLPDGTVKVLVEGVSRAKAESFITSESFMQADAIAVPDLISSQIEAEALARSVVTEFEGYVKLNKKISPEVVAAVTQIEDYAKLADTVASHLAVKISDKQDVLETTDVVKRLERILGFMESEISVLQVEKRIRSRVKRQMEKTQREYYLNEQMKAIQKELGDEEGKDELGELEDRIKKTKLSKEARDKSLAELKKLRQMSPMSAEATVIRNYLDWMLSLPWGRRSKIKKDLPAAQGILDSDHYGLDKVKERIIEYLAVQQRQNKLTGPILCLVGPPGVGKTSLGKSIAKATGREFLRMSLGGVRDEAEIRGHRRTYIGALPGRILQTMKRAGTANPLFMLDEIDKLYSDFRGDPASAMLEVLDPEQNHAFSDHYLEMPFDLSKVMFITTANSLGTIPPPLLDRMEVIEFPGYIEEEKLEIANRYLIPRQIEENGIESLGVTFDEAALRRIIREYTYEAGVRNLEREIGRICRKVARLRAEGRKHPTVIAPEGIEKLLGPQQVFPPEAERQDEVGVVTSLAWTETGGEIMPVEVAVLEGKGNLQMTGQMGDVMQESGQAALTYIKSRAAALKIDMEVFERFDIHVHMPEGGIPKDGPSAGITMATAIVSALTGRSVFRQVGMTGEITLRGRILPVGGVREKVLAAHRAGLKTVILPEKNMKDLIELPKTAKADLKIIPVKHMDEVLGIALSEKVVVPPPRPKKRPEESHEE